VSPEELEELLRDCPTLYHMAEYGSWLSIREHGLLSTSALLDLYGIRGAARKAIEEQRRPQSITLTHGVLPPAVIRDQIPIDDAGLRRCLPPSLTPADWYRRLNAKVFFWLTRERLLRLANAGAYRNKAHDVLEVNARALVEAYYEKIWLCPINSGCTKPIPHPRGDDTFLRIGDYPYSEWRCKRRRGERVVELAIDYGVPDIARFVTKVTQIKGSEQLSQIFSSA
jgi:hypothetical protein